LATATFDDSVEELAETLSRPDQVRVALRMLLNGTLLLVLLVTVAVVEIKTVLVDAAEGTVNPLLLASALASLAWTAGSHTSRSLDDDGADRRRSPSRMDDSFSEIATIHFHEAGSRGVRQ
jgi:hypothetical protein